MSSCLTWLIVGGGIHGTHLAVRLLAAGLPRDRLRIVDPHPQLLARWRRCTTNTGMTHLRSPAVHHLDVEPFSLMHFAGPARSRAPDLFAAPYDRPALGLFERHCERVIASHRLEALRIQGSARRIALACDRATVALEDGRELAAERVVLALGAGDQPDWPAWAAALRGAAEPRIDHIFGPGFVLPEPAPWSRVAVIGGGISAAQAALRLAADPLVAVTVISRHAPRQAQFDSDPGWLGPKNMRGFRREPAPARRRQRIAEARHRGSMPPEVLRALRRARRAGAIDWIDGEVEAALEVGGSGRGGPGPRRIRLAGQHTGEEAQSQAPRFTCEVDFVLLATGFAARRPGGALVDGLVADYDLPCAACGYPIVGGDLHWHPRVLVTGPLAELELGPVARNIAGARHAATAILRGLGDGLRVAQ